MPEPAARPRTDPGLARLNALPPESLRAELARCLDVERWVAAVAAAAPYRDRHSLRELADRQAATLTGGEVSAALARHPRIGERPRGEGIEAAWSKGEQSAFTADPGDAARRVQRIFAFAQGEYEERFGRIYLVCASGRSPRELLSDLVTRLENDEGTELSVIGGELRKIAGLRIERLLDGT